MVAVKNQPEYMEQAIAGGAAVRANDVRCPHLWSSNMADAWWIGAWRIYWSGQAPAAIRKSRGHTWIVDIPRYGTVRVRVDAADHRDGVVVVEDLR